MFLIHALQSCAGFTHFKVLLYLQLHRGEVALGIHLQSVSPLCAGETTLISEACIWCPPEGSACWWADSQRAQSLLFMLRFRGEILTAAGFLVSPRMCWWREIQKGLMKQSKPLDLMPCALFYLKGIGEALGTSSVPRINNWKINLSFPCHKLKAYRAYNMSIIEVSGYWWRSQSSLNRAHLYHTIWIMSLPQGVSINICIKKDILYSNILSVSTPVSSLLLQLLLLEEMCSWGRLRSQFDHCKWPLHCAFVSVDVVQISHVYTDEKLVRMYIPKLALLRTENLYLVPCLS